MTDARGIALRAGLALSWVVVGAPLGAGPIVVAPVVHAALGKVSPPSAKPVVLAAAVSTPDPVDRWRSFIGEASLRFGVPSEWIIRVMRAESGGYADRGGRPIRSVKGAIGLMQLMPGTWQELRAALGLGADPDDPRDNILAGTAYLRRMYDRFGYPALFAAYNAGPARYAAWLQGRSQLPQETIGYVARVTGRPIGASAATLVVRDASIERAAPDPLFAVREGALAIAATGDNEAPKPTLFAIRRDVR